MPKNLDITVPDLTGTLALVTGATDGVGFEIAARLARAGAEVIMPARNLKKGESAAARIQERTPNALIQVRALDLASLESVETSSERAGFAAPESVDTEAVEMAGFARDARRRPRPGTTMPAAFR